MKDLLDILAGYAPQVGFSIGVVTATSTATGRVSVQTGRGVAANVPYLLSYTPAVNDKVQLLSSETIGYVVLGKVFAGTAPLTPTTRVVSISATRSMSWIEDTETGANGHVVEGNPSQGIVVTELHSGAYSYPAGSTTLLSTEIVLKAELLLSRVDVGSPRATCSCLNELTGFTAEGKPVIANRYFPGPDMRSLDTLWIEIPTIWANNILAGSSKGVAFVPTSAQLALVYAEYAAYNTVAQPTFTGGTLRLTIENNP